MKHPLSDSLTLCMLALTSSVVCAQTVVSGTPVTGVAIEQPTQPNAATAPYQASTTTSAAATNNPTSPANPVSTPVPVSTTKDATTGPAQAAAMPEQNNANPQSIQTQDASAPAKATPEETSEKFAFILPHKGSRFDSVSQYALDGVLAANYATEKPAQILLIRPGADNNIAEQLKKAAEAGALAAIGPLDREAIEKIASLDFLPLPVITLNQIDLDTEIALTPEEIKQRTIELEALRMADQAARELNAGTQLQGLVQNPSPATVPPTGTSIQNPATPAPVQAAPARTTQGAVATASAAPSANPAPSQVVTVQAPGGLVQPLSLMASTDSATASAPAPVAGTTLPSSSMASALAQPQVASSSPAQPALPQPDLDVSIASDLKVPGLVLAEDVPAPAVRYEPRLFPRNLLMMGLSMETDAEYVAELGLQALPRLTEAGNRPKVLVLDQNHPLQKKISAAFCKVLTEKGFAPDRLTIDLKNLNRITQFFELIVEDDDPEIEPEEPVDQEADPVAWRQQQLRQRRESAERRAQAAFAEPPYYAVFMALDASTASQIRPRLPIRTRVWGTPLLYPGNPTTSPSAKALTYDLKQVSFVESPFILNFDESKFEETYKVAAPNNLVGKRLFSLGADAFSVAKSIARGQVNGKIDGLTGSLTFDLETSPIVGRRGTCAMIGNGVIRVLSTQELIDYHVIAPGTRYLPKGYEKMPGDKEESALNKDAE